MINLHQTKALRQDEHTKNTRQDGGEEGRQPMPIQDFLHRVDRRFAAFYLTDKAQGKAAPITLPIPYDKAKYEKRLISLARPFSERYGGALPQSDNPATWATYADFERARAATHWTRLFALFATRADDAYMLLDFDNCVSRDVQGRPCINRRVRYFLDLLNSYWEFSPSGTGVRAIAQVDKAQLSTLRTKIGDFEQYGAGQFVSFTGERGIGAPEMIHWRTAEVEAIYQAVVADEALLKTIAAHRYDGPKYLELTPPAAEGAEKETRDALDKDAGYRGVSEADAAFVQLLMKHGADDTQVERVWRGSVRWRDKCEDGQYHYTQSAGYPRDMEYVEGTIYKARQWHRERQAEVDEKLAPIPESVRALMQQAEPTDLGLIACFLAWWGADFRYEEKNGDWLVFDGVGFTREGAKGRLNEALAATLRGWRDVAHLLLKNTSDAGSEQADAIVGLTYRAANASHFEAVKRLLASQSGITISIAQFDTKPHLFVVANGVLELGPTITFREGRRDDFTLLRAKTPFHPAADCPLFRARLAMIHPDAATRWYLQKVAGYALLGGNPKQNLWMSEGSGSNGKSTFWGAVYRLMGDYAGSTTINTLANSARGASGHSDALASLRGKRLVLVPESRKGVALDEAIIKQITGGDPLQTSHKGGRSFEYIPGYKVQLMVNTKPAVTGVDYGCWRRLIVIPFTRTFISSDAIFGTQAADGVSTFTAAEAHSAEGEDPFHDEYPGVLNWLLEGLMGYFREGLQPPEPVREATLLYRFEQDTVPRWLGDCVLEDKSKPYPAVLSADDAYRSYQLWCDEDGERQRNILSREDFNQRMGALGFPVKRARVGGGVDANNPKREVTEAEMWRTIYTDNPPSQNQDEAQEQSQPTGTLPKQRTWRIIRGLKLTREAEMKVRAAEMKAY